MRKFKHIIQSLLVSIIAISFASCSETEQISDSNAINLLEKYPTTLTEADTNPSNARKWLFTPQDLYHINSFQFQFSDLNIQIDDAALGVGHTKDGAVWAIVVPDKTGALTSAQDTTPETIEHIWIRLHPGRINRLFPPENVKPPLDTDIYLLMKRIAQFKIPNSYHAGPRVMVPAPGAFVFDIDTNSLRRFFHVDEEKQKIDYADAFEELDLPDPVALDAIGARDIFDRVWKEFDASYAMFAIKPDVDWEALRREYSVNVEKVKTKEELLQRLSDMLGRLQDEHIWIKVDGMHISTFKRNVRTNGNPKAYPNYIDDFQPTDRSLQWGRTKDDIGFIAIHTWSDDSISAKVDQIVEDLKNTKAIIVDVRMNGGGGEPLAQQVAGRFVDKERVYAFSQYRNGPQHENLTRKYERSFQPTGEWQYDKPVIVLIGQRCMSSNEAFVKMMGECPNVTLMGEATRGSSGNPKMLDLPMGIQVSVPQWIDYRADGKPLEGNGVEPDVEFIVDGNEYGSETDSLLAAALNRLRTP